MALCGPLSIVRHSAAPIGASNQSLTKSFCSDILYVSTDFGGLPSFAEERSFGNLSSDSYHSEKRSLSRFWGWRTILLVRQQGALCSLRYGCCRARQPPHLPFNMHRHRMAVCKRSALRPKQAFCYRSLEPAFRIQGVVSIH